MTGNGELTNNYLNLLASLSQMLDAVSGYRKQCEEQGFSPTAAEAMAIELHRQLMVITFRRETTS